MKQNTNSDQKEITVMAKFADHMEKIESGVVEGYKKMLNSRKKKYAPEILKLSEKIMKG